MKIGIALTYYRPHISGLTIYVERLAHALVARGHEVTVLTSQYDKSLPREETMDGVRVVRVPVAFRVSKGVIMPSFGFWATRLVRESDVLSVHLPQFDAWGLALRARLMHKPCVLTYHCDLQLPAGPFNRLVDQVTFMANYAAASFANRIIAYTRDYADHSRLLRRFKRKIDIILPPVVMPEAKQEELQAFRAAHCLRDQQVLGFAARFATEKGVETLLDAMPLLMARFPTIKVLFAGPYKDVPGEEAYRARLFPRIEALGDHWEFLGTLSSSQMPAFMGAIDCLLVPSLNSTESFGLVQVEAMLCGTPCVASDLPGVRQPVRMTGMGEVIPIGDGRALAEAVTRILTEGERYLRPRAELERLFDLDTTVSEYETVFQSQLARQ